MADLNSIIVIIRSSGERTEKVCLHSVLNEGVKKDQIHIIRKVPFKNALEACFRKAIESNSKWLLTLDADMILIPGVLSKFLVEAERMPHKYLQIQGRVVDKFYGTKRSGGPRFYKCEYLEYALRLSRELEDHIRPESNIIKKMGSLGYASRYISVIVSLHDFEQYYSDLYRKACVYAVKHMNKLPIILSQATNHAGTDPDFKMVLKGIFDSLYHNMAVSIDKRLFIDEAEKALSELELIEKSDISIVIQPLTLLEEYIIKQKDFSFEELTYKDVPWSWTDKFKYIVRREGLFKSSIIYFGYFLSFAGEKVIAMCKK